MAFVRHEICRTSFESIPARSTAETTTNTLLQLFGFYFPCLEFVPLWSCLSFFFTHACAESWLFFQQSTETEDTGGEEEYQSGMERRTHALYWGPCRSCQTGMHTLPPFLSQICSLGSFAPTLSKLCKYSEQTSNKGRSTTTLLLVLVYYQSSSICASVAVICTRIDMCNHVSYNVKIRCLLIY